jgi:uncharacterized cupredoxin-like copper-binding protein
MVASAALAGAGLAGWMVPGIVGAEADVPRVMLTVRHSRFLPDRVAVAPGATVRFVVRNDDPIDHEFIVGPEAVHLRHESGTEASHGAVPGEVSLPAGETAETTYTFAGPGPVAFACHLPGHLAFGMQGQVVTAGRGVGAPRSGGARGWGPGRAGEAAYAR